ncbi:MAG: ABC transporter substrate-binding protein [Candidatus Dormibacteraceae bacterium]
MAVTRDLKVGACLSLSGKYSRFGRQAARGLEAWQALEGAIELRIEDDRSDKRVLVPRIRELASSCDLLLGPYSTILMRAAGEAISELDCLLWNHGGSGDDVEEAGLERIVSILTPTGRYAEPFLKHLANEGRREPILILEGRGSFGRQIATGTELIAQRLNLKVARGRADEAWPLPNGSVPWNLLAAASFEEDLEAIARARSLSHPPRTICAVAAGVREFGSKVQSPGGIFGIAQWFPGSSAAPALGPIEDDFLTVYSRMAGGVPDYPAAQAAAAGVIAKHCLSIAGDRSRAALWSAAAALDTSTLFGGFQINPLNGTQSKHETLLVEWQPEGLVLAK